MDWTPELVKASVAVNADRLFQPYATGRPQNWACDQRTKDVWCIGQWLDEKNG